MSDISGQPHVAASDWMIKSIPDQMTNVFRLFINASDLCVTINISEKKADDAKYFPASSVLFRGIE